MENIYLLNGLYLIHGIYTVTMERPEPFFLFLVYNNPLIKGASFSRSVVGRVLPKM